MKPCFDGRALTVLLFVVVLLIGISWFAHERLQTGKTPPTQGFEPKAAPKK